MLINRDETFEQGAGFATHIPRLVSSPMSRAGLSLPAFLQLAQPSSYDWTKSFPYDAGTPPTSHTPRLVLITSHPIHVKGCADDGHEWGKIEISRFIFNRH